MLTVSSTGRNSCHTIRALRPPRKFFSASLVLNSIRFTDGTSRWTAGSFSIASNSGDFREFQNKNSPMQIPTMSTERFTNLVTGDDRW